MYVSRLIASMDIQANVNQLAKFQIMIMDILFKTGHVLSHSHYYCGLSCQFLIGEDFNLMHLTWGSNTISSQGQLLHGLTYQLGLDARICIKSFFLLFNTTIVVQIIYVHTK